MTPRGNLAREFQRDVGRCGAVAVESRRHRAVAALSQTKRPAQEKKGKAPIGPLMIGFFLFVVVGSSVLQIVQMAGTGGKIAQQMENQQPRAEPQPRPRKKKPTPAADP